MSIKVDKIKPNLLKAISEIAIEENIPEEQVLEDMIEKGIERRTKNKIPEELITNKDTYNPNPKKWMESAGMIKNCKPFNAAKLVRKLRQGE